MVKEEKERLIGFISPKVVLTKLIPFKWCLAINLFNRVYAERNLSRTELQHELIHSLQMKDLGYVRFYLSYLCEWARLLFKYKSWYLGYLNVSYEKEAYTYQADIDYIVKKYERICKKHKQWTNIS